MILALFRTRFLLAFTAILPLLLGACVTTSTSRGYTLEEEKLSQIKPYSTKEDIRNIMGTPSTLSDYGSDVWYYISKEQESIAFLSPKTKKQQVIAIYFDTDDYVDNVKTYSEKDIQEIALIEETTPTYGKEQGVFKQLLGNVGRFSDRQIDYADY